MDDDKLLKKIEESASDIQIPKSLEPEEIRKRLEAEIKRTAALDSENDTTAGKSSKSPYSAKSKVIKFRRYAAWAAAAAVFLSAMLIAGPALKKRGDTVDSAEVQTVTTAAADSDEAILHVNDYEELLAMVKQSDGDEGSEEGAVYDRGYLLNEANEGAEDYALTENNISFDTEEMASAQQAAGAMEAEAGGGSEYSSTNIQEKDVDEADIVKTDGTYIYTLDSKGNIRIVEAGTMKLTGEISDPGGTGSETKEMYIDGDILQVISTGYDFITTQDEVELSDTDNSSTRIYHTVSVQGTIVTSYDISDRSSPEKTGTYKQDGAYLSSRKNGNYVYIFTSYMPQAERMAKEEEYYYYVPRSGGVYIPCESIYLPGKDRDSKYTGRSYLVAGAVENTRPSEPSDRIAVVSGAETFYVSQENIYAANSVWERNKQNTDIVRLGYKDGKFTPGSCGRVPGILNDSFSMNEFERNLRVVTTNNETSTKYKGDGVGGATPVRSNALYVLDENLSIIGKIDNLAKGEQIESARFMGDTGYFVTYKNVDPLFSVDLSDPENPQILGELKITGFSEYLHFYGEDKLLGIGWETDPDTGEREGLKCSMFDLSDPANVREADKLILTDAVYCDVMDNYKAILADPEKNLFGFAYAVKDENWQAHYCYGVFSYSSDNGFQVRNCIQVPGELAEDYDDYSTLRGLYIGNTLYVSSRRGMESYDMEHGFEKKASLTW
ncbi:MAG: beta-propeller domain-containing protein [Eubacteriales bacterium]|nr:beta-propeller domain-containing protein [Eubacteriales bacterium]